MKIKIEQKNISPDGILDLFPECDISIREDVPFKDDLIIRDVCSNCNNTKLGGLDSYGKKLILDHFVQEYKRDDMLTFEYDYKLLSRWLLKICYNYSRSHKLDVDWFVKNVKYLLDGLDTEASFTIYSGLSVNTSPAPAYLFGNIKMSICHSLLLCDTGFLMPIDALGEQFRIIENPRPIKFEEIQESFVIRLGSALFVIFLWKDGVEDEKIQTIERLMSILFRHKKLDETNSANIVRCTEAMTYHLTNIVVGDLGIIHGDMANGFVGVDIPAETVQGTWGHGWEQYVQEVREKHEV